jgi:glycosyltransferase involved in cell wall biosynthesis
VKISVVIPNFNDLRIKRAIDSVTRQTHRDYELLVIDGGSRNKELLDYYKNCGADKVVVERDGGIFDAINKGVRLSTGDIIYLMGSDDELSDTGVFADVVRTLSGDSGLDGVCVGCEFVDSSGRVIRSWYPTRVTAARIKRGILPPHFSLFLKKELYSLVGEMKFREYNNVACDVIWLLDLALLKSDLRIKVLNNHCLRMEYGGASTGSFGAVARQFRVVWRYAKKNARHLNQWYLYSPVRTFSKVFQFRFVQILRGI